MPNSSRAVPSPVVALAGWLVPGGGYLLIRERARGLAIGISIVLLYVIGLLIGGVRVVEVPGYGDRGGRLVVTRTAQRADRESATGASGDLVTEEELVPEDSVATGWVMLSHPMDEIRNKPWYVAQVLVGPFNLLASWGSIHTSHPDAQGHFPAARSHARTNELGVLYTAVAGMLNLLAVIDATYRAAHKTGDQ